MSALYNEIEPFAAQWLRNLVAAGHVAAGGVEERSIRELRAEDVRDVTQFHTFAGIGVWSYALKLAGWPDSRPVWTGSCPCQPFSAAGKRAGTADPRHLWPEWFRLIRACRPGVVFGEQVASSDSLGRANGKHRRGAEGVMPWFDVVSGDLEAEGYTIGAAVLGSHSVGAPHIRQRLYFVAYASGDEQRARRPGEAGDGRDEAREQPPGLRDAGELADSLRAGRPERRPIAGNRQITGSGSAGELGNSGRARAGRNGGAGPCPEAQGDSERREYGRLRDGALASGAVSFWSDAEWIPCRDGKLRPVEPGTFPLAHGAASRVGRLRAYGNALNAEQAATFIRAAIAGRP